MKKVGGVAKVRTNVSLELYVMRLLRVNHVEFKLKTNGMRDYNRLENRFIGSIMQKSGRKSDKKMFKNINF